MEEAKKIKRAIAKGKPAPRTKFGSLLDANTGRTPSVSSKAFDEALGLTGLILTKLDGTAKGGRGVCHRRQCPLPLRFIGVGEGVDDLRPFAADEFVSALLDYRRRAHHLAPPGQQALSGGFEALRLVSFAVEPGDAVPHGHSGAGKTTLLKLIAAIERANGGAVLVNGRTSRLAPGGDPLPAAQSGLVFQGRSCSSDRSVFDNVMLP